MVNIELKNKEAKFISGLIRVRRENFQRSVDNFHLDLDDPLRVGMQEKVDMCDKLLDKLNAFGF